jgi:hypothetical protein
MTPMFNVLGNLPLGVYEVTGQELSHYFGTNPRRRRLLAGLKAALEALRAAGCRRTHINGTFATAKRRPAA